MLRVSDAHTDQVLSGVEQISELLRTAPPQTWRRLITAGGAMHCADAGYFTLGVALAINHNRAALLMYAWRRIQEQVRLHLSLADEPDAGGTSGGPLGAGSGAGASPGVHADEEDLDRLVDVATAQLPLCATIMAMTLADLIDDETFDLLIESTATAVGPALRTAVRGHA